MFTDSKYLVFICLNESSALKLNMSFRRYYKVLGKTKKSWISASLKEEEKPNLKIKDYQLI